MTRVKRGTIANKRRKNLLKEAKGFRYGRKNKYRQAKEALLHAWSHSFKDRKRKKREKRQLWEIKINAAARENGITYSQLINHLRQKNIKIDRKILAELSEKQPHIFQAIVAEIKK
ncbi:MAG: large subunit ribosomal protein [Patescibacteria group bacterium]|nr:large subunit ribosomal protein [Patescibacteria group bacterium]